MRHCNRGKGLSGALLAGGAVAGAAGWVSDRYRRDLERARARLAAEDSSLVATPFGPQEYVETGAGEPLLVCHGILHGCGGGVWSVKDVVAGRRVISPSRFGYLRSAMPPAATPADQADAYASILDQLHIRRADVIGISAGTSSALQFALRHPDRVGHLAIMSGNLPGNPTATSPPRWTRMFFTDRAMWAAKAFAPGLLNRAMGVPRGFPRDPEEALVVSELVDSIFPVAPRTQGAIFDAFVSNPDVHDYPLEDLRVPTLLIHAKDDPLCSYSAAQHAAERIPEAAFVSLESGGHLELGQTAVVRRELAAFLSVPVAA